MNKSIVAAAVAIAVAVLGYKLWKKRKAVKTTQTFTAATDNICDEGGGVAANAYAAAGLCPGKKAAVCSNSVSRDVFLKIGYCLPDGSINPKYTQAGQLEAAKGE